MAKVARIYISDNTCAVKENIDAEFLSKENTINSINDNIADLQQNDEELQEAMSSINVVKLNRQKQ